MERIPPSQEGGDQQRRRIKEQPNVARGRGEKSSRRREQRFRFGPWVFNVDRAQEMLTEQPREPNRLAVQQWAHAYALDTRDGQSFSLFSPLPGFDRDYAMTTDLSDPLIVATLRNQQVEEFPLLIDGTHRLYRAHVEGVSELPTHVLTVEQTLAIREDAYYR